MKIRRERHRVWSLSYHAVFVVKYRKPCITDEIADFLLDEMRHLLEGWYRGKSRQGSSAPAVQPATG